MNYAIHYHLSESKLKFEIKIYLNNVIVVNFYELEKKFKYWVLNFKLHIKLILSYMSWYEFI
jgi:hypothetical protein